MRVDPRTVGMTYTLGGFGSKSGASFAEMLASGYSVDAIRSQRAFGFAETGIMGAPRPVSRPAPEPGAVKVASSPSTLAPGSAPATDTLSRTSIRHTAFAPGIRAGPSGGTVAARTGVLPNARPAAYSLAQPMQSRQVPSGSVAGLYGTIAANPHFRDIANASKRNFRRRQLTLTKAPDGIAVDIRLDGGEEVDETRLFTMFLPICWQFGVTLTSVRLFNAGGQPCLNEFRSG